MGRSVVSYPHLHCEGTILRLCAVHIYRLVLNIENGVSATEPVELALIRVPQGTVDDIKFVDDEALMLSVTEKCWCSRGKKGWEILATNTEKP